MTTPAILSAPRRHAYRVLLYAAALDARSLTWFRHRGLRRLLPIVTTEETRNIRLAGAVAYWLHNLAMFSAVDFASFSEDDFWSGLTVVAKDFPKEAERYRQFTTLAWSVAPGFTPLPPITEADEGP